MHNNLGNVPEDIGLVYMAARWYSPTLGRFISADTLVLDPTNPQSYNRYSYVLNRALNFTDPTGHREADCSFSGECGFNGNTWIGQWLGWESKPVIPAIGASVSASIDTPMISLEFSVAREDVLDTRRVEVTSFLVIGGDLSIGPNRPLFLCVVKTAFVDQRTITMWTTHSLWPTHLSYCFITFCIIYQVLYAQHG